MFSFIDGYDVQETRRVSRAEGKAEGEKKGKRAGKREDARGMKTEGISIETIAKITGLSVKAVEKL
jgi:predicted transposase/invertase (TIGR01784 family)